MHTRGVQRRLTLAPAADSARTARRLVAEVLSSVGADDFTDTATLLTSELVTNGIVHAHTEMHVIVEATPTWVRVEVVDGNPQLPSRREYDEGASTGRGMEMVELLADDFGVEPLHDEGKRVWFRLGVEPGTRRSENAQTHGVGTGVESGRVTVPVRLLALPITLYCAWQEHADALLREATLLSLDEVTVDQSDGYVLAGQALHALADAAGGVFAMREDGIVLADVTVEIATDAVAWFPILRDLLARAGAMAANGMLLTPPSLPELAAVRRWICDEVARQSASLPPTGWIAQTVEVEVPAVASHELVVEVRAATVAQVAADAYNRIIAVSEPAAQLLGWTVAGLEGRRLVTIIPARLRDRHIAGFTRHLLDGSRHIIGRAVSVPALRRDGSEIEVELLIERRSEQPTRGIFVATLSPTADGD